MSSWEIFDVVGVGSPIMDILAQVPEEFLLGVGGGKGGMVLIDATEMGELIHKLPGDFTLAPGGSAANTIQGLGHMGLTTCFLGKLGEDPEGELYKDTMAQAGVNHSRFKNHTDLRTGKCVSLITPDTERTMRTHLGAAATLSPADIIEDDFLACRLVHMEGYVLFNEELARHVLASARSAECKVSLDLASFEIVEANKGILPELLESYVDVVFANEDEARAFTGEDDPRKALDELSEYCETVAVKIGAKGAWLHRGEETIHVDAEKVQAVDTTGAGDLWAAGFLYGYLVDADLETCGRLGAVVAAEVVQVISASIPDHRWKLIIDTYINT